MYCVKCGVRMENTEKVCPLCQTKGYHPELFCEEGELLYPSREYPHGQGHSLWLQGVLSVLVLLAALIVCLCDIRASGGMTWSGLVIGAILTGYVICILPTWFPNPNPVIFVPCAFAAVGLYLRYINFFVGGDWFLSFAFPLTGGVGLIITAMTTLLRWKNTFPKWSAECSPRV